MPEDPNVPSGAMPGEVIESVASANFKTLGDGPAFYTNMHFANSVAHQQGVNTVLTTLLGKICESIIAVSPAEGGADIAALGQLMKGLSLTPPPS